MCPPVEIPKAKKITVLAKRGYFDIFQNKITHKVAGKTLEYISLDPEAGTGRMCSSRDFGDIDPLLLLYTLTKDFTELCFFPQNGASDQFLKNFIFGDLLPFPHGSYPTFYLLKRFIPNIFEEFYRLTEELEDPISTTMATFETNVFLPFKQKIISAQAQSDDRARAALDIVTRDFSPFIGLHADLQKILNIRAVQLEEYQQLSLALISPFLRKVRMVSTLKEYLDVEGLKKQGGVSLKFRPSTLDPTVVAERLTPLVRP